jgi:hypothetical protein
MRSTRTALGIAAALLATACGGGGGGGGDGGTSAVAFVHTAVAGNTDENYSRISHPLLDGNPGAVFFVTHATNPGGAPPVGNPHHIGVFYEDVFAQWAVFNQDDVDMPEGAAFHVSIPEPSPTTFVHVATVANIPLTDDHATTISHPSLDGNAGARFLVTPNWDQGIGSGTFDDHPIGVWYDGSQWNVFNEDFGVMPVGAAFNVTIPPSGDVIVHTTNGLNNVDNVTWIDHPALNDNPDAMPVVTQLWNRPGLPGVYNADAISLEYDDSSGLWLIENANGVVLSVGASFVVRVR